MNKLNFLTAGIPLISAKTGYKNAFTTLKELNLDGMELEFVHGVKATDEMKNICRQAVKDGFILTAHAPFYINLNSKENEKIEASIKRIIETANVTNELGGYSIVFHAAFYMGGDKQKVFDKVVDAMNKITTELKKVNNNIFIRPETTGKATQWGTLEEIIELSKLYDNVLPCVDFSHIYARNIGKYNTYDDFCKIIEKIGNELGNRALDNFHAHVAGIEYTKSGERRHLIFEETEFNYKDLLKAMKSMGIKGTVTIESPNIEIDTQIAKEYYLSL